MRDAGDQCHHRRERGQSFDEKGSHGTDSIMAAKMSGGKSRLLPVTTPFEDSGRATQAVYFAVRFNTAMLMVKTPVLIVGSGTGK